MVDLLMKENTKESNQRSYIDEKNRKRWYRNEEVAAVIKQLGDYLIIGGYPEEHAKRYGQLAHTISRMPELIDELAEQGTLHSIPGVGGVITNYNAINGETTSVNPSSNNAGSW